MWPAPLVHRRVPDARVHTDAFFLPLFLQSSSGDVRGCSCTDGLDEFCGSVEDKSPDRVNARSLGTGEPVGFTDGVGEHEHSQ